MPYLLLVHNNQGHLRALKKNCNIKLFHCTGIINDGGKADYAYYWTSTSAISLANGEYPSAWYVAFGQAEDGKGENLHGAGAVRFDRKTVGTGEGEERVINYVRLVRNIK